MAFNSAFKGLIPYSKIFVGCRIIFSVLAYKCGKIKDSFKNYCRVELRADRHLVPRVRIRLAVPSCRWSRWPRGLRRRSRQFAGIVGSNPVGGMNVCLVWALSVVRCLCVGPITRPGDSYRVCCFLVWPRNLDIKEALVDEGCRGLITIHPLPRFDTW